MPCDTYSVQHDWPYRAIIMAATDRGCDLIVMASHGRKGITGELVGSETARVIGFHFTMTFTRWTLLLP